MSGWTVREDAEFSTEKKEMKFSFQRQCAAKSRSGTGWSGRDRSPSYFNESEDAHRSMFPARATVGSFLHFAATLHKPLDPDRSLSKHPDHFDLIARAANAASSPACANDVTPPPRHAAQPILTPANLHDTLINSASSSLL